jgi:steroid delta-isomerase-like uncharacterized protein
MPMERNKAVIRRYFDDIINGGNPASGAELFAPDYTLYFAGNPPIGVAELAGFAGAMRGAFPDFRDEVEDIFAEEDRVAARGVSRGTHQGEFMGIPASGKEVVVNWISLFRLTPEGRIQEARVAFDQFSLLQQIGAIPAAAPA